MVDSELRDDTALSTRQKKVLGWIALLRGEGALETVPRLRQNNNLNVAQVCSTIDVLSSICT